MTEHVDTSTPGGKFTFHLFGALAEMERDVIRQRTKAGLEAARARARIGGRPALHASCQKTPAGQGTLREERDECCRDYGADRLCKPLQLV
jgi:DNA invertase Pin-like site-specific DNA recombinase